jgi:hypothetical protein
LPQPEGDEVVNPQRQLVRSIRGPIDGLGRLTGCHAALPHGSLFLSSSRRTEAADWSLDSSVPFYFHCSERLMILRSFCQWTALWAAIACLASACGSARAAHSFRFQSNLHGTTVTGQSSAVVTEGAYGMSLTAGPVGAALNETHPQGMGIDSRGVAGARDVTSTTGVDKLNVLEGPASGASETITFSFNRKGVIRDLLFDGVKDETLEYFQLTLPNGELLTFIDAEAEFRLTQQGFSLADLNVPNIMPLIDGNDDRLEINLPFAAGDTFVLSYGNHPFPTGYVPLQNELGNGARLEGLVIVPEPSGPALALCGTGTLGWMRRKQR